MQPQKGPSADHEPRKPGSPAQTKWFSVREDDVYNMLGTDPSGISESQVAELRARFGYNEMATQKRKSVWKAIFKQVHQLLIYILLIAAVVSALLGSLVDTAVILAVVLASIIVGFAQERKADKAVEALDKLVVSECAVVRGGSRKIIPSRELVPGDVVLLESGNKVPADMRLIYAKGLQIEEAILTGESVPAEKTTEALPDHIGAVADMTNMAFAGTLVTYGRGRGIVVGTGDATEISKISACMRSAEDIETPLQKRIAAFAIYVSGAVAMLAILTFVGGLVVGQDAVFMFLASVSVAVSIIPEGLPALVTVSLALGVRAMASRNAIVRNLPSVETLGSTTVICSDKTGTLTMNQMTVVSVHAGGGAYEVTGTGYSAKGEFSRAGAPVRADAEEALRRTLIAGAVCNDSALKGESSIIGDPTEGALMVSAAKAGIFEHPKRLDEIPFESDIQYMATLNKTDGGVRIYLKGVPEKVVRLCADQLSADGSPAPLDSEDILARANGMAASALRVIALAEKTVEADKVALSGEDMAGFTFLGLQGMMDPPRPEAVDAVKRCQEASIRVVMITGDHAVTAAAIAAKLGIVQQDARIVTGDAVERMSDEELYAVVEDVSVYARASPIHKYRIVQQLRKHGEVIAVTGDGVNDAPALRAGDIGVAMGVSGTDVAKEASDMILADDNFATIVNAVEEGRHMYNNLQKMLAFILPTNVGQCLVIVFAIFTGSLIPLLPLHILWINLVTSVSCSLPLAVESKEEGLLKRPPRDPDSPLFTNKMIWRLFMVSTVMTLGAFVAFYYSLASGVSEGEARSITMTAIVLMELAYLFSSRSMTRPAVGKDFFANRWIFIGSAITILAQMSVIYLPILNTVFRTEPIHPFAWVVVLGTAFSLFAITELEKVVVRHIGARADENTAAPRHDAGARAK